MAQAAAKQGDQVMATDIHIVMMPSPGGPIPTPLPHPFTGILDNGLSQNVNVQGMPAATQGSTATNTPAHIPQGGPFQSPPKNQATVQLGSSTVMVNGKPAARNGDTCMTCNDPSDLPAGTIIAASTVMIGG